MNTTLNGTTAPVTRRPTTRAANWPTAAACRDMDDDPFFSDQPGTLNRLRTIACSGCPVLVNCLRAAQEAEEGTSYLWGLRGGLTADQRRALRAELLLGSSLDLDVAKLLLAWRWRTVLMPLRQRGATPSEIAEELTVHGLTVSPATARVAVWWMGGRGPRLPRRGAGDRRPEWQLVRDECQDVVERLRELGARAGDVAAYLGVSRTVVEQASKAWSKARQDAGQTQEVGLAA